jgi:hypothetical protein
MSDVRCRSTYPVLVLALEEARRNALQLVRVHGVEPLQHLVVRYAVVSVSIHLAEHVGVLFGVQVHHLLIDAHHIHHETQSRAAGDIISRASGAVAELGGDDEGLLLAQAHAQNTN